MATILYHAVELFCFCLAIHILVWRTFPVRHQGIRLGLIFSLGAVAMVGVYALATRFSKGSFESLNWPSWGLACMVLEVCNVAGAGSMVPNFVSRNLSTI